MGYAYRTVPTLREFQQHSSITLAIRSDDRILKHLDWLLECYDRCTRSPNGDVMSKRRVILCDLFLTCNYWIKCYHELNPRMKKERYSAVTALFDVVVD